MNRKRFLALFIAIVFVLGTTHMKYGQAFTSNKNGSRNSPGIPVLLYHHLVPEKENPDPQNSGIVTVESFEQQIKYLAVNGYKTATLEELEKYIQNQKDLPPKTVVITFDDGYQSNYLYAYPILKKYGFKATIFVITSYLRESPAQPNSEEGFAYLSWPELEAGNDVFSYQSHSHSLHWENEGGPAIYQLKSEDIKGDLVYSSQLLGSRYFSYPFGAYDERAKDLVAQAGYTMAFTTKEGVVRPGDDPLELKRFPVFSWTKLRQFVSIINQQK